MKDTEGRKSLGPCYFCEQPIYSDEKYEAKKIGYGAHYRCTPEGRKAAEATNDEYIGCTCNLVTWLRAYAKDHVGIERDHLRQAADDIERLRGENEWLHHSLDAAREAAATPSGDGCHL